MTDSIHLLLTAWAVFGAACSVCLYLREVLRQHRPAIIRTRSQHWYPKG